MSSNKGAFDAQEAEYARVNDIVASCWKCGNKHKVDKPCLAKSVKFEEALRKDQNIIPSVNIYCEICGEYLLDDCPNCGQNECCGKCCVEEGE